jgi:type IV fimbrial biogenesis protein FimT
VFRNRGEHQFQGMLAMKNAVGSTRSAGFTLIELMVTITIAAILLMVAAPSFVAFKRNSELTSISNSLVAAMNAARGEAMKRGARAMVTPLTGGDWSTGWTVFVDVDRDGVYTASSDITVLSQPALQAYFTASSQTGAGTAAAYVLYDPSGYSKTTAAAFQSVAVSIARNDISGADLADQTRRVVVAVTGRVRACKPATDTSCVAGATE